MLYWKEKLMKYLMLLALVACSTMSDGSYKKKFHLGDYKSSNTSKVMHEILVDKMTKCYKQSGYPAYEQTVSKFDHTDLSGEVAYVIDNQTMGPQPLVIVDVLSSGEGSLVKVYSNGGMLRPAGVYKHQIQKWVDGKTVDCGSHGQI
jgi:hypothetical protein